MVPGKNCKDHYRLGTPFSWVYLPGAVMSSPAPSDRASILTEALLPPETVSSAEILLSPFFNLGTGIFAISFINFQILIQQLDRLPVAYQYL